MTSIARLLSLILLLGLSASMSGCANARSFFQMSSDSPLPFFGLDFTLPNKLGERTDVHTFGTPPESQQASRESASEQSEPASPPPIELVGEPFQGMTVASVETDLFGDTPAAF